MFFIVSSISLNNSGSVISPFTKILTFSASPPPNRNSLIIKSRSFDIAKSAGRKSWKSKAVSNCRAIPAVITVITATTIITATGWCSAARAPLLITRSRIATPASFSLPFLLLLLPWFALPAGLPLFDFRRSSSCLHAGTKVVIAIKLPIIPIAHRTPNSARILIGDAKFDKNAATVVIVASNSAVPTAFTVILTDSLIFLLLLLISSR